MVALIANSEGQEARRKRNDELNGPEHPRAPTTDDVECFISCIRNDLGPTFNIKSLSKTWSIICREFEKRMDESRLSSIGLANKTDIVMGTCLHWMKLHVSRLEKNRVERRDTASIQIVGRSYKRYQINSGRIPQCGCRSTTTTTTTTSSSSSSNARGVTRRKLTVIVHAALVANIIHITGQKHEVVSCMHAAWCEHLLARQHMYALITQTTCMQLQLNLICAVLVHFICCRVIFLTVHVLRTPRVNTHLDKRADKCCVQLGLKLLV